MIKAHAEPDRPITMEFIPQAFLRAKMLIRSIELAESQDLAEQNTLLASGFITQLKARGLISDEQHDELTGIAAETLRDWESPHPG